MSVSAYDIAKRLVGLREIEGAQHQPFIQWALTLCGYSPDSPDEIPWCSAFVNAVALLAGCRMTHSAAARSWLRVGEAIDPVDAHSGWDVVVLSRGPEPQPGPGVILAPGHVGFFAGWIGVYPDRAAEFRLLGGNQSDRVSFEVFPRSRILGVRRLR